MFYYNNSASIEWMQSLTLITSIGVEATALPKLAIKLDLKMKIEIVRLEWEWMLRKILKP